MGKDEQERFGLKAVNDAAEIPHLTGRVSHVSSLPTRTEKQVSLMAGVWIGLDCAGLAFRVEATLEMNVLTLDAAVVKATDP